MAEKYDINRISYLQNRDVFVDSNILIYWNWATGSEQKEREYSSVYQKLMEQKNRLFADFFVISEVVNRMIKEQYRTKIETEKRDNPNFSLSYKKYRDSDDGQQILKEIYTIIKNQIEYLNIIEKSFSEEDIINFLNVDNLDFNDKGIVKICQENKFVLLTDDHDYKNSDIDILTCNKKILN